MPERAGGAVKVAVYGVGGVGGYFGGRLALGGSDVHLIARGPHLSALRERGLRVFSVFGDFETRLPATDDPGEIGPCDYVLFCVKSFDTESAATHLQPLFDEDTAVISLQNGIDNEEKIAEQVGRQHVLGGAAFIFSSISEPGVISHTGGPARIVLGEMDGRRSERAARFRELCQRASIAAELSEDIRSVLWEKLVLICAQAGMTGAVQLPIGEIRRVPESWAMFRLILQEVAAVAKAEGVDLLNDAVERALAFAQALEPGSFSSLYDDMTRGKRMELEALHGTVVRLAHQHGVEVPMCEAVYAILRPWAARKELQGNP